MNHSSLITDPESLIVESPISESPKCSNPAFARRLVRRLSRRSGASAKGGPDPAQRIPDPDDRQKTTVIIVNIDGRIGMPPLLRDMWI